MANMVTQPGEVYLRVVRSDDPIARVKSLEVYDASGAHVGDLPFTGFEWKEQFDSPGLFCFSVHSGRVEVADGF